ncbi:MAG TPA: hypothetical protein VF820_02000, partial [Patescibacteria group bacterium]
FTNLPLRISWLFVLLFLGLALFSLFQGFTQTTLILFVLFLISIMLAIQGEYILRIFEEVRNRPNFIVQEMYGLDEKKKYE